VGLLHLLYYTRRNVSIIEGIFCGIFYDSVSHLDYVVLNGRILMNWKGFGRKIPWRNQGTNLVFA
jgi:hypothetical protein